MISISNIAWDVSLDEEVSQLMSVNDVNYVDIAHSKYITNPSCITDKEIENIKLYWISRGIKPLGMQSLFFGTSGLNIFSDAYIQDDAIEHLSHICHIGDKLGARKLVFGSPRNRDKGDLSKSEALDIAIPFFNKLGDIALKNNVTICLEPNPECYNSNFMTNSIDTFEVVTLVAHESIKMQLDTGAMNINREAPGKIIDKVAPHIGHIHISEPNLQPLTYNKYHNKVSPVIREYFPDTPVTIEMLTSSVTNSLSEIEVAIDLVKKLYKD